MAIDCYAVFYSNMGAPLTGEGVNQNTQSADLFPAPTNSSGQLVGENFFELNSWGTGVEQMVDQASGQAGTITFEPFQITRVFDPVSSGFLVQCAQGQEFECVDIIFQVAGSGAPGASDQTFLAYRFEKAALSTIGWTLVESSVAESLAIEYAAVTIGYRSQNSNGTYAATVFNGWNRITNQPTSY